MPIVATSLLALCALTGAWLDVATRRLPNWLCLATALAGLTVTVASGGLNDAISPALHAGLALAVGMALFGSGLIGGGDAKFYAACAAWFPLSAGFWLVFAVSLAGLLLVLGWLGYRKLTRAKPSEKTGNFALVPYGLAVAAGALSARLLL
ncbi:MAG TPA: prepilin peptidase [Reyranella sp.]|nr:prepilin peptidase [Reyranella sp.]